jgi:hypothetical protein
MANSRPDLVVIVSGGNSLVLHRDKWRYLDRSQQTCLEIAMVLKGPEQDYKIYIACTPWDSNAEMHSY